MIMYSLAQSAVEYVSVTLSDFALRVLGFAGEAIEFVVDHPILLVILVVLAIVFSVLTRPRTH